MERGEAERRARYSRVEKERKEEVERRRVGVGGGGKRPWEDGGALQTVDLLILLMYSSRLLKTHKQSPYLVSYTYVRTIYIHTHM